MGKILFITQKIDLDDDLLGTYHSWVAELAKKFATISVICLYKGKDQLPKNVAVYSLGKETGSSRIKYLKNFYQYIWRLRHDYDTVFVHMNPEYVILGGLLWKLWNKKIILWYAHYLGTVKLRLAALLANKIVTSTQLAYPFRSKKLQVLQQGIDTERFRPQISNSQFLISKDANRRFKILFLGRIAPVKRVEVLLQAFSSIKDSVLQPITLTIVGGPTPGKPDEFEYYESLKKLAQKLNLGGLIEWRPRVPNFKTPELYNVHDLFINLTVTGSFDKSTLEAMACGLPVIVSNKAFREIFPAALADLQIFEEKNPGDLARKIERFISLSDAERESISRHMRRLILEKHSLSGLTEKLTQVINGLYL